MDERLLAFLADDLLGVVGGATDFAHAETGAVGVGKDADDIVGFDEPSTRVTPTGRMEAAFSPRRALTAPSLR